MHAHMHMPLSQSIAHSGTHTHKIGINVCLRVCSINEPEAANLTDLATGPGFSINLLAAMHTDTSRKTENATFVRNLSFKFRLTDRV